MGWFKDNIFSKYFGRYYKLTDSYKNLSGEGLLERYNQIIGEDIDEELVLLLENITDNTKTPNTMFTQYFNIAEDSLGLDLYVHTNSDWTKRKLIERAVKYYSIRGSKKGYEYLFKIMGFTFIDLVIYNSDGFDTGIFDDGNFDGRNGCCIYYNVILEGPTDFEDMTNSEKLAILKIIDFNEPINATLGVITVNGEEAIFEKAEFICKGGTSQHQKQGEQLDVSINVSNVGNIGAWCEIEIDFGEVLINGDSPLNPEYRYSTEDGVYEHYNLSEFTMIALAENDVTSVVIGLVEVNQNTLVDYGIIKDGKIVQAGIIRMLCDGAKIEIGDRSEMFDSESVLDGTLDFSAKITGGNAVLDITVGNFTGYELIYRYI